MYKPTLQITQKKYTGKSSVISIRLPKDMLDDLDRIAGLTGRTRNELMTMSLEFALTHMDVKSDGLRVSERRVGEERVVPVFEAVGEG